MHQTLITGNNVGIRYGSKNPVLSNVSFTIKRGEMVSLIGLNGAGKSTLLKTMIGMIQPSSGSITKYTDKIGFIPQSHDLNMSFPLTVSEFCKLYGSKKYHEFLEQVDMNRFLKHKLKNLSGGQLQRVMIALALSQKPDLLLLDEPTSGIDIVGQASFYELIHTIIKNHDIAVVVVSHDVHLVLKYSTQVICLTNHVCCTGTPKQVTKKSEFIDAFGKHLVPYIHHHK